LEKAERKSSTAPDFVVEFSLLEDGKGTGKMADSASFRKLATSRVEAASQRFVVLEGFPSRVSVYQALWDLPTLLVEF
jgi:uncharacterized protein (DUF1330 family)